MKIPTGEAVIALRDLNEYVISLDRILSRIGAGGEDPEILVGYIVDRDVFRRLAGLREVIGDALQERIGEDAVDEIAEESYRFKIE